MTDLVPAEQIERIVGARRDLVAHIARAVSAEQTVYILHSQRCLDSGRDLRQCPYSIALDRGITKRVWRGKQDQPVAVAVSVTTGKLIPSTREMARRLEGCVS